ncbi:MAG TPA: tetratricopeptide repeat protein [Kofleriaceae bacterium]|nr:tetratricopeptide repeat protein [Kofleriaceae bacterium]
MPDDERTRRWQRLDWTGTREIDPIHMLRSAINMVRAAPRDPEARRRLRGVAAEQGNWEELALLLADEARAAVERPELAAAFYEELADVHENLDQPLEVIGAMEAVIAFDPHNPEHHDRLAWLYRRAGASVKAAESFERVAVLAKDDRARAALRAAGRLYRESGRLEQAIEVYRNVVDRRPSDIEAWRALDELLTEMKRWREAAEVRGELAGRANGVEKAVLLRSQARALEQAGEAARAAELVASAAGHAPEDVSGLVDLATVLAREGRTTEAIDVLTQRIEQALREGATDTNVAAMRLRLVEVLDATGDRVSAQRVLDQLLESLPEYVPALQKLVQFGAQDPDPRVHAEALLRLAAVDDGPDMLGLLVEAARRYRAAGDLRRAAHTFERATELSPDDDALRAELQDAQTALVVEIAAAEAGAGDSHAAERSLRKILLSHPMHLDANLALADLLTKTNRAAAAIDHLRDTLADAPEDTEPALLAKLVHRVAVITRTLGDADEAHQLLHEAHHLDRKNLLITLALGESCFGRKLWRETAIHLGSLAEHPDARKHRSGVGAGLVKAAQAEARALKPQNAPKHYEAAVRIDPECAPAWHALAELATEAGDIQRAAECLEREANATKDADARLRLFDALGDLARDVLGDFDRAERCWAQVAQMNSASVLKKLVAVQRRRGATIARAETCERLAALGSDERARKELTEEAAEAYAAGRDYSRAQVLAEYLVSNYPHDIDAVGCAARVALTAGSNDRAANWLRRALHAWEASGNRGDGDPRRADLWRRLGDAEKARHNERNALDAYQRAVSVAPESDAALGARRGLIELAASAGRSANTSRLALVEAEQDPNDVIASARELAAAGSFEEGRAMYELARTLGVELLAEDEQFLDENPPRPMASDEAYAVALDDRERRALVDDEHEGPLADLMLLLGEAANLVCPDAKTALDQEALFDARRVASSSEAAVVAMFPQIAKALGGPPTLLYADPTRAAADLRILLASPPVVVIGPRLSALRARSRGDAELDSDAELRFRIGRVIEQSRPHRLFVAGVEPDLFARLVAGLWHAFGKPDVEPTREVAREAERLRHALPVQLRRRMTERLASTPAGALDLQTYRDACERAADRAGMLACGHTGIAIHLAGGVERAAHLVRFAASQKYLAARRKLRRR